MSFELSSSTRMALRATAVATAAVAVSRIPGIDRPYWIVLTAVMLIYETAGESIKRSGQRLAMTLTGCLTGWLLYLVADHIPPLRWSLLLGGIFLAVYFRSNPRGVVYAPMVFFISVYVVFVFAIVGGWTGKLFVTRIYDTAIGCALALGGSLLILPQRAGNLIADDLAHFWDLCRQYFEKTQGFLSNTAPPPTSLDRHSLLKQLEQLRLRSRNSAFDGFMGRNARKRQRLLVESSEIMSRHLLAFAALLQGDQSSHSSASMLQSLGKLMQRTTAGFHKLCNPVIEPQFQAVPPGVIPANKLYSQTMEKLLSEQVSRAEILLIGPELYHLGEVCYHLEAMLN
ncbi:hypothetical protein BH10PLA2_BH10PLA2_11640 [soil metagenome]